MSYAQLSAASASVAAGLAARGIERGDCVFVFVPMAVELYVTLFAVLRLGAVAVFLDSWARRDQLSQCALQVRPRGFVGPEPAHAMTAGVPGFEDLRVAVRVGPGESGHVSLDELALEARHCEIAPVSSTDSALVTFTTGSSGVPKGADRTHGFLVAQHEALRRSVPYTETDVDLPVFPVFSLNNLASGVTTVLPDLDLAAPRPEDGDTLLTQILETAATCATLSPSLLRAVIGAAGHGASCSLRRVVTGGAPIGPQDIERFAAAFPDTELHILYGSTEVEPIAHLLAEEMPGSESEPEGVCLGAPTPDLRLRFITPTRGPVSLQDGGWERWHVEAREGGELLVAGAHVCQGYFRNPDAMSRAKVRDQDGTVWHRTGDVCRLDERGRLWMLGRVHNAIRRAGRLLFPVTAEMEMRRLPFVARAGYVGVADQRLGEAAWAVFTRKDSSAVDDPVYLVRRALADAGVVVDRVLEVDAIPMDPRHHSKVDVDALRRMLGVHP
jgi:acyl-coenzyme A synthetase/AMP-(fatty) acid ligase